MITMAGNMITMATMAAMIPMLMPRIFQGI